MIAKYLPRTRRVRSGALLFVVMIVGDVGRPHRRDDGNRPSSRATAVPLGTASTFGVLAGSAISNTGPTTVNGDIGTFPTTSGRPEPGH